MTDDSLNDSKKLLNGSSLMGLAALLHDLGKFAERARLSGEVDGNLATYCPLYNGQYTHKHAAYTAIAIDAIESHLPDIHQGGQENLWPFASQSRDDSLISAAARHHDPKTPLQKIIATADRMASGFERRDFEAYERADEENLKGNHYQVRLATLFEQLGESPASHYRYPLRPLAPLHLMPKKSEECMSDSKTAQKEYSNLWEGFVKGLAEIPPSHRGNLSLWLDHFDSLFLTYSHTIPSATVSARKGGGFDKIPADVSLYDHSKAVAALAVALWRFHLQQGEKLESFSSGSDGGDEEFLLIQGDFFGIQEFLFASGGETNRKAAKLLRGRSFYVSLLTELAALKVLEAFQLPSTSQIINAAGKFLIVAPNLPDGAESLRKVQKEVDDWFLEHTFGQGGIGLASLKAKRSDFSTTDNKFKELVEKLFASLERVKLQRFDLCREGAQIPQLDADFENGACAIHGRLPAAKISMEGTNHFISQLAYDQLQIGVWLTKHERLLVSKEPLPEMASPKLNPFGFYLGFTGSEEASGAFGQLVAEGKLLRAWDFSLPGEDGEKVLWNGYGRRYINGYVPRFTEEEIDKERYRSLSEEPEEESPRPGEIKSFNHLACENKGVKALATLKGDVDNLGKLFREASTTFARWAGLSRQMNAFFAIRLPWLCCRTGTGFQNSYTVFAGGDDFFLIGPWNSQINLAAKMRKDFSDYVAQNPHIHFSVGLSMTKPGLPIQALAALAEEALEQAKGYENKKNGEIVKNAVTCYGRTVSWDDFTKLQESRRALENIQSELQENFDIKLSTAYLYGLIHLCEKAGSRKPEDAIWNSWFTYRTRRFVVDRIRGGGDQQEKDRRRYQERIAKDVGLAIRKHKEDYKIALFTHLYQQRDA